MNCLHICNGFLGSKVHRNLYKEISNNNIKQTVYYYTRAYEKNKILTNEEDSFRNIEIIGSKELNKIHRILFRKKINFLYNDITTKLNIHSFDIIHATTLYSDGALAYKLNQKFNIPYIVAVRGVDVNIFSRYRPDLQNLAIKILKNASKIIFISKSLENNFFKISYAKKIEQSIKSKCDVIYNGLDSFWLKNTNKKPTCTPSRILYIGNLSKNKNVIRLIKAVIYLRKKHPNLTINIVGKNGKEEKKIKSLSYQYKDIVNYIGPIYNNLELKKIYNSSHIFAMTSISETFGLVYIEALTQGLPILYSRKQGIDGSIPNEVGASINPLEIKSIAHGLDDIIKNYSTFEIDQVNFSPFHWNFISLEYLRIYTSIKKI